MDRHSALDFIRQHSKLITSMLGNPVKKADQWDDYEPIYFEQRMGRNGTPFILQDTGKNGWDLYFIIGGNSVTDSLREFAKVTGLTGEDIPQLSDLVQMK